MRVERPRRAVASPSNPTKPLQSASSPLLQLSGTTGVGPCVLGARLGADTSSGRLGSWSLGLNYNRMTADEGTGGVERLNGQQVGRNIVRVVRSRLICLIVCGLAHRV